MISPFDKFVAAYIGKFGNPAPGQIDYEAETVILTIGVVAVMDGDPAFQQFKLEPVGEPFECKSLSPFPVEKFHMAR